MILERLSLSFLCLIRRSSPFVIFCFFCLLKALHGCRSILSVSMTQSLNLGSFHIGVIFLVLYFSSVFFFIIRFSFWLPRFHYNNSLHSYFLYLFFLSSRSRLLAHSGEELPGLLTLDAFHSIVSHGPSGISFFW